MDEALKQKLLAMPAAKQDAAPWKGYYHTTAAPWLEMRKDEAEVWNYAREWVLKTIREHKNG